ncbi:lysophospholipase L1-like esterase [Ruminiclostridium sufflavum DSM 19573]|uniref:Lysophospholipase L1-like esterase n=1 Tax=Ruminiclostridium sufflavum DSM 19573 TaxID=1121337 RepID=A0A318XHE8_9FIRM|nr:SGNH/GDSL hydrolase family protein [Ruminiclostridium sufflavum]PYG85849.1 lysophospholipase L1-like esterase [Ruminiclostridium sufflavum DSM 19573]
MAKYSLCSTYFKTLPEGWVNNGFIINNGLQSPVCGGINTTAYWDIYSTLDAHIIRARIKIADIQSSFALFKKYHLQGGIGIIDCGKRQLSLYKPWLGEELPEIVASSPITIEISENREYVISYEKENGSFHRLKITDTVTGQSNEITYLNSSHPFGDYAGKQWGAPGIMFLKGNILVKRFEFISEAPQDSRVMIFGDSITEGHGMDNNRATYHERCSAKVRDKINGSCVICGRGSGDSADLLDRLNFELERFKPRYVVVIIGTNDTDIEIWQTNIEKIIAKIRSKGANPVICVPPVGGELVPQIAEYLQNKDYAVVRMDYATSLDHDGVTQDKALFLDELHPNTFGNLRMYKQLLIDAPEIFE